MAAQVRAGSSSARTDTSAPAGHAISSDSGGVRFDAAGHPIVPIVLSGYCEGEDCGTSFDAVACLPTGLRPFPSDTSPITLPIAAGDSVHVARRDLRVLSPGVVVVTQDFVLDQEAGEDAVGTTMYPRADTVRLARGDTLYLISYLALGRWSWALRTRLHDSEEFWAAAPDPGLGGAGEDSSHAVARSRPTTEDWWLVQARGGASGWWHGDGHQELQSVSDMQHWSDDCDQVRKRSSEGEAGAPAR